MLEREVLLEKQRPREILNQLRFFRRNELHYNLCGYQIMIHFQYCQ